MTTIISKRSKASHVSSILKSTSLQSRLETTRTPNKVRFQLPYAKKVRNILEKYVQGENSREYEDLVVMIRDAELFDDDLKSLLGESTQCISILKSELRLFVEALLSINWTTRGAEVVSQYQSFVVNLCCAHNYHTKYAMDKLVSQFLPDNAEAPWEDGIIPDSEKEKYENVHWVINVLMEVIPMSKDILLKSLFNLFPYMKRSSHVHEVYIHNLINIMEYKPKLRVEILRLIFTKLIILDVNAPREEIQKIDAEEDEEMFEMDENHVKKTHPIAESLDLCLDKLFNYFVMDSHNLQTGDLIWDKVKDLYRDMLGVFDQIILPTYNTHHVQFSMFILCALKTTICEGFLNYLWKKVSTPTNASVLRVSAASYIASLIARATFVPVAMLKGTLQQMGEWIHSYIANQDGNEYINCDIRLHSVFYNVCQGLFYVIAFRQKELVSTRKNITFLQSLNLGKIVTCKLNPLRVCQPAVVQNFAAVTRTYQLAYCYAVIENNSRNALPILYQDDKGGLVSCSNVLDNHFPFDPYILKSEKIHPFYLNYQKPEHSDKETQNDCKDMEVDDFLATDATFSKAERFSYGSSPGFKIDH